MCKTPDNNSRTVATAAGSVTGCTVLGDVSRSQAAVHVADVGDHRVSDGQAKSIMDDPVLVGEDNCWRKR